MSLSLASEETGGGESSLDSSFYWWLCKERSLSDSIDQQINTEPGGTALIDRTVLSQVQQTKFLFGLQLYQSASKTVPVFISTPLYS